MAKVGYEQNPLEDGSLDSTRSPHRDGHADHERARGHRAVQKEAERARTCSRWACCRGCTTGRPRAPRSSCGRSSPGRRSPRRSGRVPGRPGLRRDDRGVRGHLRGGARAPPAGRTATSPAIGAVVRARRGRRQAGLPLFLGSYPITPASDILHELSKHKTSASRTFQAEDEIAGIGAALGAAFGGALGVTTTSGPGVSLKSETISLAVALELPLLNGRACGRVGHPPRLGPVGQRSRPRAACTGVR